MEIYFAILRFLHIGSGIIWIGLLYYFNLVHIPSMAKMEAPARPQVVMTIVSRALLFFRHTAWATVALGLVWFLSSGFNQGWDVYMRTAGFKAIVVGGTLGAIMMINVWMFIWPNQRKIIAATTATVTRQVPAPPEQARWARKALLASRTNVMLSVPMLFFMVASAHLPSLWAS
ncbi:MAG: hypothetical protein EXR55_02430 [Dehalococcoidia bacterium]|nr:hypothetical protein [Dehalococcoidia bacterium]